MKYSPVVSTLQEWLDGKVGTQGLDAVSCAFYVLSLLQREQTDEQTEAFWQFPHSKVVGGPGLSCWPRDGWSTWAFGDAFGDALAVHSLLTPAQGYELELLGNELSPHLKNIQHEDGMSNVAKQSFSLLAENKNEKCCNVFSGVSTCNDVGSIGERSSTLQTNDSACVGFSKHKLEGGGGGLNANKNCSPFMAEGLKKQENEEFSAGNRNLFVHNENLVWGDNMNGPDVPWNIGVNSAPNFTNILKEGTQAPEIRELWEADTLFKQFSSSVSANMSYVGTADEFNVESLSDKEDDRSLAQLKAKFDHSIAAIWNLGSVRPLQYDLIDEPPEFSWDVHNLLSSSSPEDNAVEPSFIHCGTNITSSIWSDQEDSGTRFVDEGVSMLDGCADDDHSELCCKLKVLLATDGLLQNQFSLFDWNSGIKEPNNPAGKFIQKVPEEWGKIQTFPSLFSDVSFQEQFCNVENNENKNCSLPQDENSCMISCSPCPTSLFGSGPHKSYHNVIGNRSRNFNTLNHNREDSSFTEVIPRHSGGKVVDDSQAKPSQGVVGQPADEHKNEEEEEDLLTSSRTHFRPIHQDHVDPHNKPGSHYSDGTTFLITSSFLDVQFKRSESGALLLESDDGRETPKIFMEFKEKAGNNGRGSQFSKNCNTGNKTSFVPKFCVRQIEKYCQTDESDEISEECCFKRIKHNKEEDNLFFSDEEIVKSVADYLDDDCGKFEGIDCKENMHDMGTDDTLTLNLRNEEISKSFQSEAYVWNKAGYKCNSNYLFPLKSDSLGIFGASVLSEKEDLWSLGSTFSCQSLYSIWSCSPVFSAPGLCASCESATLCERRESCALREELRSELSADGEQLLSDLRSLQPVQLEGSGGTARVNCAAVSGSLRAK